MSLEGLMAEYVPLLSGFSSVIALYPYAFVFVGLLVGGETVLLPAIYLALAGPLKLSYVMAIMVISTVVSDIIWYYIGRGSMPFLSKRTLRPRVQSAVMGLSGAFRRNASGLLFISKFAYGTRIAAQVLCGMHKMNFRKYLAVNTAGVFALGVTYVLVVYAALQTADVLGGARYRMRASFGIILIILLVVQFLIRRMFKTWSR